MNQQLSDYINSQRSQNISDENIRQALVANNWHSDIINEHLGNTSQPQRKMLNPFQLIKESYLLYQKRFLSLFLLSLFQFLPLILLIPVIENFQKINVYLYELLLDGGNIYLAMGSLVAIVVLYSIGFIVVQTWSLAGLTLEISSPSPLGIQKSLQNSWKLVKSFWWINGLMSLLIAGVSVFLVIPGVIYTVWFIFSLFVLTTLGYRGLKALIVSREYVRNHYWDIFSRLVPIALVVLAINWIFEKLIGLAGMYKNYLGSIVIILYTSILGPLLTGYVYFIYRDLMLIKGILDVNLTFGLRFKYLAPGLLGFIIFFIGIPVGIFLTVNPFKQIENAKAVNTKNVSISIERAIERYYAEKGEFPKSFDNLVPDYLRTVPMYPENQMCYTVEITGGTNIEVVVANSTDSRCNKIVEYPQ